MSKSYLQTIIKNQLNLIKKHKKSIFAVIGISAFLYLFFTYGWNSDTFYIVSKERLSQFGRLSMQFEIGAMYYIYRESIIMDIKLFLGALVCHLALTYIFDFEIAFALFGSYLIIFIGFGYYFISKYYNKIGDLSYAVYILSFFVQQRIIDIKGISPDGYQVLRMDPYQNLGLTILIVLPLAFISWHCFEKQLLKLK